MHSNRQEVRAFSLTLACLILASGLAGCSPKSQGDSGVTGKGPAAGAQRTQAKTPESSSGSNATSAGQAQSSKTNPEASGYVVPADTAVVPR
jgi:hypothetical protein